MYKVDRGVRVVFSQEDGEENGEETTCVRGPMGKRKKTHKSDMTLYLRVWGC